jgi:hypothetical protein
VVASCDHSDEPLGSGTSELITWLGIHGLTPPFPREHLKLTFLLDGETQSVVIMQ